MPGFYQGAGDLEAGLHVLHRDFGAILPAPQEPVLLFTYLGVPYKSYDDWEFALHSSTQILGHCITFMQQAKSSEHPVNFSGSFIWRHSFYLKRRINVYIVVLILCLEQPSIRALTELSAYAHPSCCLQQELLMKAELQVLAHTAWRMRRVQKGNTYHTVEIKVFWHGQHRE